MSNTSVSKKYLDDFIGDGDSASAIINRRLAATIDGNEELVKVITEGMNGVAGVITPKGYEAVAFTVVGDVSKRDPLEYIASAVRNVTKQSKILGVTPVGFSDNLDVYSNDLPFIEEIANVLTDETLKQRSQGFTFSGLNGECAILPGVVSEETKTNISITVVGYRKHNDIPQNPISQIENGIQIVRFNPKGKLIYMNSDGVGTKPLNHVRRAEINGDKYLAAGYDDEAAMRRDDSAKIAARVIASFSVLETRGDISLKFFQERAKQSDKTSKIQQVLLEEKVGDRILGYKHGARAYSLGGTNICIIDEQRLKKQLIPNIGDRLIVIQNPIPNPRSNGISALRQIAEEMYGSDWHKHPEAKYLIEYLSSPSTILYPLFMDLIQNELATAVYHMSGGALNGKLAKPLLKHGLHASIDNLFPLSYAQEKIIEFSKTPLKNSFAIWPNNNEAYVTASAANADLAMAIIRDFGLNFIDAGRIEKAENGIGVTLNKILDSAGAPITYTGGKF